MGRSQLWDKPSILRVKVDPRCRSTMFDPCLEQYFEYMGSIVSSLLYCSFSLSLYIHIYIYIVEGSLEVKLPTIWTDEKQSREEAERRERLEERRVEEKD